MVVSRRRRVAAVAVVGVLSVVAGAGLVATGAAAVPPPAAAGYFSLTPAGTTFPTEASCADQVHRSSWEPRPENVTANHTSPPAGYLTGTNSDWNAAWNANYRTRVTGNFQGTTDEIIQFEACKWGWSDNLVRAEAVDETGWVQSGTGDTSSSQADCFTGYKAPCPTSFGFLQVKWYYNPSRTVAGNSMPYARSSTAFSLDYTLAELRGCYDGMSTYLGNTKGDVWNCIGSWYSGDWASSGSKSYQSRVQGFLAQKPWLTWADKGTGVVSSTTTTVGGVTTTRPATTTTLGGVTTTRPATTTTTTTRPPAGPQKWWQCVNDAGRSESTRAGLSPQVCAHPTDRYVTWTVEFG